MPSNPYIPGNGAELVPATTYPHLVVHVDGMAFRRERIGISIGPWPIAQVAHENTWVIHPEAFNADGTLSAVCRSFLISTVQGAVRMQKQQICINWSQTSCTYVEGELTSESRTPPSGE